MTHLTALRALKAVDGSFPVTVKLIVEGSEEQGTDGLEDLVPQNADLLRADTVIDHEGVTSRGRSDA